ncbi:TspO/MBR family protein [Flavobacterium luteum]|uniref:Tryptophan-rich sensory protein n=1 Tax=Flavobacterium luteum TaxID=2026654 RepID=A0A7J5AKT8_9FLAO|nr:TspO/MBR family protein [Flavobacterium luteum]KAB1157579.1 tryptophan-rich sensory protein [Flavobacterium luteum]
MSNLENIQATVKLVISILFCQIVGIASILFSEIENNYWYESYIVKTWNISIYSFGAIWVLLYFLVGISMWYVWTSKINYKIKTQAIQLFIIQLFLNFLWFLLFFKFHFIVFAFLDISTLIVIILMLTMQTFKISKTAFYLLIPYLVWVFYEVILNIKILLVFNSYKD